ncbi:MAG: patatin-like phospholipase family protein [Erysipelothrix sp.]|jgi:predicted patatin/cPLA2 family phospholipase|nr:patatin-like phospholipase family protein [Erysipelothrix sp.]
MSKLGLVLEGGGLRAAYTAGVLRWFKDNQVSVDFVVGVSSGALLATLFVADENDALKLLAVDYASKKENVGWGPMIRELAPVGYNFLFKEIVQKTLKLDMNKVINSSIPLEIGIYDLYDQKTLWLKNKDLDKEWKFVHASCVLPIAGRAVRIGKKRYLDAGLTSMIAIDRSLANGCDRHIVITTKDKDFVRPQNSPFLQFVLDLMYARFPIMRKQFRLRTGIYYEEKAKVEALEEKQEAIFLRPSKDLGVKRFSGDYDQLNALYDLGYQDTESKKEAILQFIR